MFYSTKFVISLISVYIKKRYLTSTRGNFISNQIINLWIITFPDHIILLYVNTIFRMDAARL